MSIHNFNFNGIRRKVYIEKYSHKLTGPKELKKEINLLLENCWGRFSDDFVEKHILSASKIIIARVEGECIGLCAMNFRNIFNLKIHYIEFLLINKNFQKSGLGLFLSFLMIKDEIIKNIFSLILGKPLEIFFITPNIRVLSSTAKISSFIYPNPYLANDLGKIYPADEKTWNIALELLKNSDNPQRELAREGLVLKGSYINTPWLIYNNDNAPWDKNEKMNIFAKRYLAYHNGEDKEFMVRAHINIFSLIKYLFK